MSSVTLTSATRQNLLSLQDTANLLSTTQNRLSTGKKVSSALDDPVSFFTSQSLTNRSSDLSSLLNGISNGVQTLQAANQGITSIQKLVDSAKSTANQALADKSGAAGTTTAAATATVSGNKTFQGLAGTANGGQDFSTLDKDGSLSITLGTGSSAKTSTIRLDSSSLAATGTDLTNVSASQVASAINSQIANDTNLKGNVQASVTADGRLTFSTINTGATQSLTVAGAGTSTIDIGFGKSSDAATATTAGTGGTFGSTLDLTGGKRIGFTVFDGSKSIAISVDANSTFDDAGTKLGSTSTVSRDNVVAAINKQLKAAGSTGVASYTTSGNNLKISSTDKGSTAAIQVTGGPSDINLGFSTSAVTQGGTPIAFAASTTAEAKVANTAAATTDFSNGKSARFTLSDGVNSTTVTLDASTAKDGTGGVLGSNASSTDVAAAIQKQLTAANVNITVSNASSTLKFTAAGTVGATQDANQHVNLTVLSGSANIGFGTDTFSSASSVGTGTATAGLTATGSDATDGSAKAVATLIAPTAVIDLSVGKNANFTIQLGSNISKTIKLDSTTVSNFGSNTSLSDIADAINKQLSQDSGLSGYVEAKVVSTPSGTSQLQISSTKIGADQKFTLQAAQGTTAASNVDIGLGVQASGVPGVVAAAAKTFTGANSATSNSSTRQSLANQFNDLLTQITQQAKDSSYNGVNLLYRNSDDVKENTLHITFNEGGSSSLDIKGKKFDADGLGLTAVTGGFQSDDDIKATLTAITNATGQLRAQSSTFGSNLSVVQNRQDFSKNLIAILDTGSANLTNADLNEEAANSQALSTRNSIATSALSLANQAQQGILQLLR